MISRDWPVPSPGLSRTRAQPSAWLPVLERVFGGPRAASTQRNLSSIYRPVSVYCGIPQGPHWRGHGPARSTHAFWSSEGQTRGSAHPPWGPSSSLSPAPALCEPCMALSLGHLICAVGLLGSACLPVGKRPKASKCPHRPHPEQAWGPGSLQVPWRKSPYSSASLR